MDRGRRRIRVHPVFMILLSYTVRMQGQTLLVTMSVKSEQRHLIQEQLPPDITCQFLEDISSDRRANAVLDSDAILSWRPQRELTIDEFALLHNGQIMQFYSAGVDYLPLDQFPNGVVLQSNAGAHADPIAEHVLAFYFALSKRLRIHHKNLQAGDFDQFDPNRKVAGSVCGIVGYGGIGQAIARHMKPLGVSILGINRRGEAEESASFIGTPDDLDYLLRKSDGVVITAPLTPETRGIIDREKLRIMASDAMLINVARGELVKQHDLYHHLKDNPEFQAGIDTWWKEPLRHGEFELEYPFLELPNVIGSPHNAAQVPGIQEQALTAAIQNVVEALKHDEFTNVVDPELGY